MAPVREKYRPNSILFRNPVNQYISIFMGSGKRGKIPISACGFEIRYPSRQRREKRNKERKYDFFQKPILGNPSLLAT
jgi:hypothetical protein